MTNAIVLGALTAPMLTGCVSDSYPDSDLRRTLLSQADNVEQQFVEILEEQSSADKMLTKLQRGHLGSTYTILEWSDEDFDSPTLSYPGAALYEAVIVQDVVVIRVAFTSATSQGGIAPKETIGYACAEFSGRPGAKARESLTTENVTCTTPMVQKSFDGEGYVAMDLY